MEKLTLIVLAVLALTGCDSVKKFETTLFKEFKESCEAKGGTVPSYSFGRTYDPFLAKIPTGTILTVECDLSKDK